MQLECGRLLSSAHRAVGYGQVACRHDPDCATTLYRGRTDAPDPGDDGRSIRHRHARPHRIPERLGLNAKGQGRDFNSIPVIDPRQGAAGEPLRAGQ